MAQFKISLVLVALSAYSASAATIVNGPLPTYFAYAAVNIPLDPTGEPVPLISSYQPFDETFTFTVSGGTGTGLMIIKFSLGAEGYLGFQAPELAFSSGATISLLPFYTLISTMPVDPAGSSARLGMSLGVPIVFGAPFNIEFTGNAFSAFSYGSLTHTPPDLQGFTIESFARLDGIGSILDSNLQTVSNAVVDVQPIPEPPTATGFAIAIVLISGSRYLRLWRRSTR